MGLHKVPRALLWSFTKGLCLWLCYGASLWDFAMRLQKTSRHLAMGLHKASRGFAVGLHQASRVLTTRLHKASSGLAMGLHKCSSGFTMRFCKACRALLLGFLKLLGHWCRKHAATGILVSMAACWSYNFFKTLVVYSVNAKDGPEIVVFVSASVSPSPELTYIGQALPIIGKPAIYLLSISEIIP